MRRSRRLRIADTDAVEQYRMNHDRCAVCRIPDWQATWWNRPRPGLECHHIARAANRSDEPANLLMLCHLCHAGHHSPPVVWRGQRWPALSVGHMLWAKDQLGELDEGRLLLLMRGEAVVDRGGARLPDLERPPEMYMDERHRWN